MLPAEHFGDQADVGGGTPVAQVSGESTFVGGDLKRLVGVVRSLPLGLALAIGQKAKVRDFDFNREVMDSIVSDFHLDFETPHGESAL